MSAAVVLILLLVLVSRGGEDNPSATHRPLTRTPLATLETTPQPTRVARDPGEVYQAILNRPYEDSELPQGYSSAKVESTELGELDKRHHAIGGARATIQGPDYGDVIFFTVFPTDGDAKAYFEEDRAPGGSDKTSSFRPAGFDVPVSCDTWHHKRKDDSDPERGQTFCDALVGSVVIDVVTSLTSDVNRGNNEAAVAICQSAVKHVKKLKGEA